MLAPGRWLRGLAGFSATGVESGRLAWVSVRSQPLRSALAVIGIVIGVVTVTLVTAVLAGVRSQVSLLFRELGTENIFAYHRTGDPYTAASEKEANRRPLPTAYAREISRLARDVRDVGVAVIVPSVMGGRALVARAGNNEADTVLVEGSSANFLDVTSAGLAGGRPFTELEERAGAPVALLGSSVARALYGPGTPAVGRTFTLAGATFTVIGEAAPRQGTFLGENRQNRVISLPLGAVRRLFPEAEATVLYVRALPGRRDAARIEVEAILRRLRGLGPTAPNDFNLSTADQIIANLDRVTAGIAGVTVALAAMALVIGGIGIANVMIIAVTERTREIGLRRAVGAERGEVLRQFLLEAAILAGAGGVVGVLLASALAGLLVVAVPGLAAMPPLWVVLAGLAASALTGLVAGYGPARRAAYLDPVEALRHE
jgi:putative ABC transport system permease protein